LPVHVVQIRTAVQRRSSRQGRGAPIRRAIRPPVRNFERNHSTPNRLCLEAELTEVVALHNLGPFLRGRSSPKPPFRLITPAAKNAEQESRAVSSLLPASSGVGACVAVIGTGAASFRFAIQFGASPSGHFEPRCDTSCANRNPRRDSPHWRSHSNAPPPIARHAGSRAQRRGAERRGANPVEG
jgi:hypothetical protein